MPSLPFEVNENYNDGGVWYNTYRARTQGRRVRMHIPLERPESPNVRLAQAGINSSINQPRMNINESALNGIPATLPQPSQRFNYAADAAIAQGVQVPMNQIKMLTEGSPNQFALPPHLRGQQVQNQWQEVGPNQILAHQMQQQMVQQNAYNTMGSPMPAPQRQVVRLWEGADFYRPVETGGFGAAVNLCRAGGRVPANWAVEFEAKGIRNCYIVPLNETRVDLARVQANPQMLTQLVEVGNPMVGTILVPQQAIMPQQQQRQVLRDQYVRQPQPMTNNVYGQQPRRMLMG